MMDRIWPWLFALLVTGWYLLYTVTIYASGYNEAIARCGQ